MFLNITQEGVKIIYPCHVTCHVTPCCISFFLLHNMLYNRVAKCIPVAIGDSSPASSLRQRFDVFPCTLSRLSPVVSGLRIGSVLKQTNGR